MSWLTKTKSSSRRCSRFSSVLVSRLSTQITRYPCRAGTRRGGSRESRLRRSRRRWASRGCYRPLWPDPGFRARLTKSLRVRDERLVCARSPVSVLDSRMPACPSAQRTRSVNSAASAVRTCARTAPGERRKPSRSSSMSPATAWRAGTAFGGLDEMRTCSAPRGTSRNSSATPSWRYWHSACARGRRSASSPRHHRDARAACRATMTSTVASLRSWRRSGEVIAGDPAAGGVERDTDVTERLQGAPPRETYSEETCGLVRDAVEVEPVGRSPSRGRPRASTPTASSE